MQETLPTRRVRYTAASSSSSDSGSSYTGDSDVDAATLHRDYNSDDDDELSERASKRPLRGSVKPTVKPKSAPTSMVVWGSSSDINVDRIAFLKIH